MIVCGSPGSTSARSLPSSRPGSSSRSVVDHVVDLVEGGHRRGAGGGEHDQQRSPGCSFFQRPGRGMSSKLGLTRSSGAGLPARSAGTGSRTPRAPRGTGPATRSTPTRPGRGGRRRPARTRRRGLPAFEEGDHVGGAVAAHRDAVAAPGSSSTPPRPAPARSGLSRSTMIGSRWNTCTTSASGQRVRPRPRISSGSWPGQVADVEVDHAAVGHAVDRVPARDPAEADRRAVEQLRGLARERHRLDRAKDVDGLEHGVVAQPRRRPVGRAAR